MSTTYIAMFIALILGFGLLAGIFALSMLSGTLNFLLVKPKIKFLKSSFGDAGFAFAFEWDQDAEAVKLSRIRLRLFNPFGDPTQVDIIREFDGSEVDFARDLDLGDAMRRLLSAKGGDKATLEIEVSGKDGTSVTYQETMSFKKFVEKRKAATLKLSDVESKYKIEKPKVLAAQIPERTFISPPLPKTGKFLKMATNPMFASDFAGASAGSAGEAQAVANFLVSKVWIDPGCIVCDACEAIAPLVFEVTDTTCIIRNGAPLEDGLKIQEAAEACPVEVIKFNKA